MYNHMVDKGLIVVNVYETRNTNESYEHTLDEEYSVKHWLKSL